MKTIYLDSEYVCHLVNDGTMQEVETDAFDENPDAYIKKCRFVPDGQTWTGPDGFVYKGLCVSLLEDYKKIMVDVAISYLDDEQAADVTVLFENWAAGITYAVGDRRQYEGKLYRCVQAHTSQADWTPPAVPALWTECAKPGEIPVWKQPTGAQDAYMIGDKVHYPTITDPVYESTIDNNVWSPEAYPAGWREIE